MRAIVPGKGWCSGVRVTALGDAWVRLGPLAEGDYLQSLHITVSSSSIQLGAVGASMGPSSEESEAAYMAGVSLVQRSSYEAYSHPALGFYVPANGEWRMRLPVGIKGETGSRYVIAFLRTLSEEGVTFLAVGAQVMRSVKVADD